MSKVEFFKICPCGCDPSPRASLTCGRGAMLGSQTYEWDAAIAEVERIRGRTSPEPPPPPPPPRVPTLDMPWGPEILSSSLGLGREESFGPWWENIRVWDNHPDGPFVSRQHAIIHFEDGLFSIEDKGSKNHVYIDGKELGPGLHPLRDGMEVLLGPYFKFVVRLP